MGQTFTRPDPGTPTESQDTTSILCNTCSVLKFNDLDYGGYPETLKKSFTNILKSHDLKSDISKEISYFDKILVSPLVYEIEDVLPDLPSLTANIHCRFCQLLKASLNDYIAHKREKYPNSQRVKVSNLGYEWLVLKENYRHINETATPQLSLLTASVRIDDYDNYEQFELFFEVSSDVGPCATWLQIPRRPLLQDHPLAPQGLELFKSWLELSKEHIKQRKQTLETIPTRLIDIGSECESPRLIITAECSELQLEDLEYAILSYCWGEIQNDSYQTLDDNFKQKCEEIKLQDLPATLRDAILVTRGLGYRYLWVDALCIIQQNKKDWEEQCDRMVDAYQNASVTIIPSRSISSNDGFLTKRDGPPMIDIPFQSNIKPSITGNLWLRNIRHRFQYYNYSNHNGSFTRLGAGRISHQNQKSTSISKWASRGWTYQELHMSPRRLRFGEDMIYFEYGDTCMAENGLQYSGLRYPINLWDGDQTNPSKSRVYEKWYKLIDEYSPKTLSNRMDRLPAISAIAKITRGHLDQQNRAESYLAGLWKGDIKRGIVWKPDEKECYEDYVTRMGELCNPDKFIAPSWSWASTLSQVGFGYNRGDELEDDLCQIGEDRVIVEGKNPFGRVNKGSYIEIHARSIPLDPSMVLSSNGEGRLTYPIDIYKRDYLDLDWNHNVEPGEYETISKLLKTHASCKPLDGMRMIPLVYDKGIEQVQGLLIIPGMRAGDQNHGDVWVRAGTFYIYRWKPDDFKKQDKQKFILV